MNIIVSIFYTIHKWIQSELKVWINKIYQENLIKALQNIHLRVFSNYLTQVENITKIEINN